MKEKKDSLSACGSCTAHSGEKKSVPYIVHESAMARMERQLKRSWILCIVMFLAFVASNAAWIYYESQFEDIVTTIEAEQDGAGTNIVGGRDVAYGSESQSNNKNTP